MLAVGTKLCRSAARSDVPKRYLALSSWDPPALSRGISFALSDCSPRTRLCWKVWATSSRSSSKPRKPPQRSFRESQPHNPASGWALGLSVVFVCQGQQLLSHLSDINSSEQNPTRTMEVLLQNRVWGLTLLPQPHLSRQLWYFSKGQCGAGQACRGMLAVFLLQRTRPA